jgi:Chaperone of endosialidase
MMKFFLCGFFLFVTANAFSQNVGIGTTSPTAKLQVNHNSVTRPGILLLDSAIESMGSLQFKNIALPTKYTGFSTAVGTDTYLDVVSDLNIIATFRGNGNVGIGDINPKAKLAITGTVTGTPYIEVKSNTDAPVFKVAHNNAIGIGTADPIAKLHIKGVGSTFSTSTFYIENQSAEPIMGIYDNGSIGIGVTVASGAALSISPKPGFIPLSIYNGSSSDTRALEVIQANPFNPQPAIYSNYSGASAGASLNSSNSIGSTKTLSVNHSGASGIAGEFNLSNPANTGPTLIAQNIAGTAFNARGRTKIGTLGTATANNSMLEVVCLGNLSFYQLHLIEESNAYARIAFANSNGIGWHIAGLTHPVPSASALNFYSPQLNADVLSLRGNGDACFYGNVRATVVSTCSDIRYKKDIVPLQSSLQKIQQLNGVSYFWKKDDFKNIGFGSRQQIGLIAQEVETIFPQMVYTDADGYKSVDYTRLTPVLIEAIKEQQKQINHLSEQVNKLLKKD